MREIFLTLVLLVSCKQANQDQVSNVPSKVTSCEEMAQDECGKSDLCFPFIAKTIETKTEVFLGCIDVEVKCVAAFTCYHNKTTGTRVIASRGCNVPQDWVSDECTNEEKSEL